MSPIDETPSIARVYDCLVGGNQSFEWDRDAAAALLRKNPHAQTAALQNRHFMQEAVAEACRLGVSQFLDVGCGIPSSPNPHEIAKDYFGDEAAVVYVDNDPVVENLANSMLRMDEGKKSFVLRDATFPAGILRDAQRRLDFSRPVAVILAAVLHFIHDQEQAEWIVDQLMAPMASGSLLVLSHATAELDPVVNKSAAEYRKAGLSVELRTAREVERLLCGLEQLPPGLVSAAEWLGEPEAERRHAALYAVVARKP